MFWKLAKSTKSSMLDIGLFIVFRRFWNHHFQIFSQVYDASFSIKINLILTIIKVEIFFFFTNIVREIIGKYWFQNTEKPWKVICQTYTIFPILEIFETVIFGGISLKGLNPASHYRSTEVVIFFVGDHPKESFLRSLMFSGFSRRFLHSFRSLHSLSTFVSKSLFKTRKISDLKGFFGDHPKKNCQSRDLYIKNIF